MSIRSEIFELGIRGRLRRLDPAVPGRPLMRTMLLSEDVVSLMFDADRRTDDPVRMASLRRDLDMFVEGSTITVATQPYKAGTAYLARLDPADDEIWEIRSRHPKPGFRIFGRFAEQDTFIALNWSRRDRLGGPKSREWKDAIRLCKTRWSQLFPTQPPFRSSRIDDYLSRNYAILPWR